MRISDWSSDVCSSDLAPPTSEKKLFISEATSARAVPVHARLAIANIPAQAADERSTRPIKPHRRTCSSEVAPHLGARQSENAINSLVAAETPISHRTRAFGDGVAQYESRRHVTRTANARARVRTTNTIGK